MWYNFYTLKTKVLGVKMNARVVEKKEVCVGFVSSDFFNSKLELIPKRINEIIETDILMQATSRLNKIIEKNKKRIFFKKTETLEAAKAEILSEFDIVGVQQYSYNNKLFHYKRFIAKIDNGSNVSIQELKDSVSFLRFLDIISLEKAESIIESSTSTQEIINS